MARPYAPSRSSASFGPGPLSLTLQVIIGANVALFLAQQFDSSVTDYLSLVPGDVVRRLEAWRLVTYMFLHADIFHILFNMLTLWMFGTELERRWGSSYFTRFYLACGVGAAAFTVMFSLLPLDVAAALRPVQIIGASGAIYGLLLAYALHFPERQLLMFMIFPMPAKYFVMVIGAIAFYSSMTANRGVANMTHLGGLVVAYMMLRGARLRPLAEAKYWYLRWKMHRVRKKFDVYEGGRHDGPRPGGWNNRVH